MKGRSIQAKGKRFEKRFAALVERMGLGMARRQAGSGNGLLKGDVAWGIERVPELKNVHYRGFPKKLVHWVEQAEKQALGGIPWLLVLRDPRTAEEQMQFFVVMDGYEYLKLELASKEPKSKAPDRNLKYKLEHLKKLAHDCMKLSDNKIVQWKFNDLKKAAGEVIKCL